MHPALDGGAPVRDPARNKRLGLWLTLLAVTLLTLGGVRILEGRARPWRPPPEQPFRPPVGTVERTSIAGIRIGEPIGAAVANVGTPTVLDAAVPAYLLPVEDRAEWDGADVYYDLSTRTVTAVDALFSTGLRTSRGDTLGTLEPVVRKHYPDAVPYTSTCAWHSENLLVPTDDPTYVLDLWFLRRRLVGATLISWPKLTELCWLVHDRRAVPNPLRS
jgi:hypothetical protein